MQNIVPMQSRQSLELRHHQQLTLTPQLQQSIRVLQLSAQDLEQEIAQALLENPLLEREEEYDINAPETEPAEAEVEVDQWLTLASPGRNSDHNAERDEDAAQPDSSHAETLQQHLLRQLHMTRASARDRALVTVLIEELDENGYLPTPLEELLVCFPPELDLELDELQLALRLLQSFDPAGVGASSLADCLRLQLMAAPRIGAPRMAVGPEVMACACEMAQHHLGLLAAGNLTALREALSCSEETLRAAHGLLLGLDPRPGRAWSTTTADYVTPEIIVRKVKNRWHARLNPAVMPRLRVNTMYERWLREDKVRMKRQHDEASYDHAHAEISQETASFPAAAEARSNVADMRSNEEKERALLQNHVQQAHGLVKSITQRFDTILRVAEVIVDHQQAFFDHGVKAMRPLLLRDIAAVLEMHESTVSRATKQKFAQTPWGVIELKRFFGAALTTDDGETTSATAVRSLIVKLIAGESAKKPLSDSQIAARLTEQGVLIARRTVAKYREAAGIEVASLRKARAVLAQR